jgi:hypothetical protein
MSLLNDERQEYIEMEKKLPQRIESNLPLVINKQIKYCKTNEKMNNNNKMNVFILGLDSVSYNHFRRMFPKTFEYLNDNSSHIGFIAQDIQKYGRDSFQIEELQKAELSYLDALEADWIEQCKTHVPNGYNVMRHSQNKHRNTSNIASYFRSKTISATRKFTKHTFNFKAITFVKFITANTASSHFLLFLLPFNAYFLM